MENKRSFYLAVSSVYTPTAADATANATLAELVDGRSIYIGSCGSCHQIYSPDIKTVAQWKSTLLVMALRAGLTAAQTALVTKYVCRGRQLDFLRNLNSRALPIYGMPQ